MKSMIIGAALVILTATTGYTGTRVFNEKTGMVTIVEDSEITINQTASKTSYREFTRTQRQLKELENEKRELARYRNEKKHRHHIHDSNNSEINSTMVRPCSGNNYLQPRYPSIINYEAPKR